MTYADQLRSIGAQADADLQAAADLVKAAQDKAASLQQRADQQATQIVSLEQVIADLRAQIAAAATPPPVIPPATPVSTALVFARPELVNPTTVDINKGNLSQKLDPTKDYILRLPRDQRLDVGAGRLSITGGRRVVVVGGEIGGTGVDGTIRATGQDEVLHLEGLHLSGDKLQEGIQFQGQAKATVVVQAVRIDTVRGSYEGHHADLLQWWGGGPKRLLIDRFVGSTNYQGMMMQGFAGDASGWDWRRLHIRHEGTAGWTLFDSAPKLSSVGHFESVFLEGTTTSNAVWTLKSSPLPVGVAMAAPPADFVPASEVGLNYKAA